jgi:hypothetical protein
MVREAPTCHLDFLLAASGWRWCGDVLRGHGLLTAGVGAWWCCRDGGIGRLAIRVEIALPGGIPRSEPARVEPLRRSHQRTEHRRVRTGLTAKGRYRDVELRRSDAPRRVGVGIAAQRPVCRLSTRRPGAAPCLCGSRCPWRAARPPRRTAAASEATCQGRQPDGRSTRALPTSIHPRRRASCRNMSTLRALPARAALFVCVASARCQPSQARRCDSRTASALPSAAATSRIKSAIPRRRSVLLRVEFGLFNRCASWMFEAMRARWWTCAGRSGWSGGGIRCSPLS